MTASSSFPDVDLRGLVPAPVTPFTEDGDVDKDSLVRMGTWLSRIDGVKGLVCLGHAGEGTFLSADERQIVIETLVEAVDGRVAIVAGISAEGTKLAAEEAQRAAASGAAAGLVYPSHGWLRFSFQHGAPQERYRAIHEYSGLPLILFQYPDATLATYDLDTQLEIASQPGVFATKNGVRNMRRWDTEIPALRKALPNLQILTCHDEYLLHTMFGVDGALVGYGCLAPEPLITMLNAGRRNDYALAKEMHDLLLPLTKVVYHRGSHMEGTVALKLGLVRRDAIAGSTVRSPLLPLRAGASDEIEAALDKAGLGRIEL